MLALFQQRGQITVLLFGGRRPQRDFGKALHGLDHHLLFIAGREVEQVGGLVVLGPQAAAQLLRRQYRFAGLQQG